MSEVGNNRTSNNKVVCCHFSSDGKLLASAGHEKKVNVLTWDLSGSFSCRKMMVSFRANISFLNYKIHFKFST